MKIKIFTIILFLIVGTGSVFPGDQQEKGNKKQKSTRTTSRNLALSTNGGYVITSSNKDFHTYYSDNLIDADESTAWLSFNPSSKEFPQWIELRWDFYPVQVNKLTFHEISPSFTTSFSLYKWNNDRWELVLASDSRQDFTVMGDKRLHYEQGCFVLEFGEIITDRLKLVFDKNEGPFIKISELCVYGPDQELPFLKDGKLYYDDKKPRETVVIKDVILSSKSPKPGDVLSVNIELMSENALSRDYIFVCSIKEKELNPDRANYTVVRTSLNLDTPTSKWKPGKSYSINGEIKIPVFAPDGDIALKLDGLGMLDGRHLKLLNSSMKEIKDEEITKISIKRFPGGIKPDTSKHNFSVVKENGIVTFEVDGNRQIPMVFSIQSPSYDKFHYFTQQAGVKFYHLQIYPYKIDGDNYQQRNFNIVDQHIRNLLRIDPEAYVLIEFDLRTSEGWRDIHSNSSLLKENGTKVHESFASVDYKNEVLDYMRNLVHFVDSHSYTNHVAGYICEIGEPEGVLSYAGDVGDYNPQAIEAFRDFAKKKYHNSVSGLRNAYKNPDITFKTIYPDQSRIAKDGEKGGVFLNPLNRKMTIDYHEFLSSMVPVFFLENVARVLKEESNREVIVGIYWAYLLEDLIHGQFNHQCNHSYLDKLIDSPYVDFFSSPFNYDYPARHAGDPYLSFQPNDVMKLHGKLQIPEEDHRTFRAGSKKHGRNYSQQETLAILKRDWGKAIIRGTGNWLSDWTNYQGTPRMAASFFLDDMILNTCSKIKKLYQYTLHIPREKTSDIAVFISGKSYYYQDNNAAPLYKNLIAKTVYQELMHIGAPYDIYLFEDIKNDFIQNNYKLYVFINPFYMTEEEREAVNSIKRDKKTLLWLYGPGFVRDANGLSTENIENATGIKVGVEYLKQDLEFNISVDNHPVTEGLSLGESIVGPDVSPRFYITDTDNNVTALGKYPDGKTAFAVKDFGGWSSIYSCVPYLPTRVLKNIARYSGCHIYVDQPIYMDAEKHFLLLTNGFGGDRNLTVTLPQKSDVYDPYSGKTIAENVQEFSVKIEKCSTLFYFLDIKPPDDSD
ncbi:MAG: hypothetical protein GWP10_16705 [Nitrospiraceae bacterium]|nr:hypothetical protein [Nitrospiraceae bacterium]